MGGVRARYIPPNLTYIWNLKGCTHRKQRATQLSLVPEGGQGWGMLAEGASLYLDDEWPLWTYTHHRDYAFSAWNVATKLKYSHYTQEKIILWGHRCTSYLECKSFYNARNRYCITNIVCTTWLMCFICQLWLNQVGVNMKISTSWHLQSWLPW